MCLGWIISDLCHQYRSGNWYILVMVDYFPRHCLARAVRTNSGTEAVHAITDLSKTFGWPRSLFADSGTHFAQGPFPILIAELGIRHFPAPKTHPQSVGLSERYVRLVTFSLRTSPNQHPSAIATWDGFLGSTIHALNCGTVKIMGYTPSQLLIGFNQTRQVAWGLNPETEVCLDELEAYFQAIIDDVYPLPGPELRIASLDEIRQTALDRVFNANKSIIRREALKRRWKEPKEGI